VKEGCTHGSAACGPGDGEARRAGPLAAAPEFYIQTIAHPISMAGFRPLRAAVFIETREPNQLKTTSRITVWTQHQLRGV
jgi:hypothetical protein